MTPARPPPAPSPGPGRPLRVMVVEDNASERWYFAEVLRAFGCTVVACADGEAALEAFSASRPEVVLLDLGLPGIDGVEVCRRLRAMEATDPPVVVAVTAREEPEAVGQVLEAGADDFVGKPVDARLLRVRLLIAERMLDDRATRRRTAEALAEKTRELQTLFENLHDVVFSVDLVRGRLIQASAATERLFGHPPEALVADPTRWRSFLLPSDERGDPWVSPPPLAPGEPLVREYPVDPAHGPRRWIRATVRFVRDAEGRPVRADGVASDITHERRTRLELARRNEELDALHRLAGISLTADSLEVAYARMLEQVTGILGTPIAAIQQLDRDAGVLVVSAARGLPAPPGALRKADETAATPDGPWREPVAGSFAGAAVRDRNPRVSTDPRGELERIPPCLAGIDPAFLAAFPLVVGTDVLGTLLLASPDPVEWTHHQMALAGNLANSLAAYAERLEAEDALRVSEARFRALADELRQANRELESFAYSVSHDLRAPLRTMQGFAHALVQTFGDTLAPEAQDYARRIIASGRQSEALITDLLAYSRISFERMDVKPVQLESVVDTAREQLEAHLEESGARLTVEGPLPIVPGNHTTLVQVVVNLLGNAVKFVPEGRTPDIRIRAEESAGRIRLWVDDNGVGVPPGQEERIFRVFERLTEGGDRPGTGIGLAIVRRGMQRIGGTCGVEARPGGGSSFWIEVPRQDGRPWRPWGDPGGPVPDPR